VFNQALGQIKAWSNQALACQAYFLYGMSDKARHGAIDPAQVEFA
jgi:hypothetical protein